MPCSLCKSSFHDKRTCWKRFVSQIPKHAAEAPRERAQRLRVQINNGARSVGPECAITPPWDPSRQAMLKMKVKGKATNVARERRRSRMTDSEKLAANRASNVARAERRRRMSKAQKKIVDRASNAARTERRRCMSQAQKKIIYRASNAARAKRRSRMSEAERKASNRAANAARTKRRKRASSSKQNDRSAKRRRVSAINGGAKQ